MKARKNIQDDTGPIEQRLSDAAGKQMPYTVPQGYFDTLPGRIMERCRLESRGIPRERTRFFHRRNYITAAAAILLPAAIISIIFLLNRNGIDTMEAGYTIGNAYEFSISNLAELEEAYLISLLGDELPDFPEMMNDAENLSGDEIIQYLLAENNIEYYSFNDQ
jgi:hypothetical protein